MKVIASRVCLCFLLGTVASGCGWWGADDEQQAFEDDLPTLDVAVVSDVPVKSQPTASAPVTSGPAKNTPTTLPKSSPAETPLARKPANQSDDANKQQLPLGVRVPLRKRVVQTLTQGETENRTTLELDITISVEKTLADGRRRFGVHYERVRYSGEVANRSFTYDSQTPSTKIPFQALPFHGMVDNDFYFLIDTSGRIELVGFDRFLRRCVESLPRANRQAVLANLAAISDQEGLVRFVDETFGILASRPVQSQTPEGAGELTPGTAWTVHRDVRGNVPMRILTEYAVKSLTEAEIEIEIRGSIRRSNQEIVTVSQQSGPSVTVRGGKTIGLCTLDRKTGLPKSSRIEQFIDMSVLLDDGSRFEQRKHVVTTLELRKPADEK